MFSDVFIGNVKIISCVATRVSYNDDILSWFGVRCRNRFNVGLSDLEMFDSFDVIGCYVEVVYEELIGP